MKLKSSSKITFKYNVDEKHDDKNTVTFVDLSSEKKTEETKEEETIVEYEYDAYTIDLSVNVDIEANFDTLIAKAKELEIAELSQKIREERNKLLQESDKEMAFDRLGLELPTEINMTNIISTLKKFASALSSVMTGEWAKYRQELRDITKQEGFPYNVVYPTKPTSEMDGE